MLDISKFISKMQNSFEAELTESILEKLIAILDSNEAHNFTREMNEYFQKQRMVDDNGDRVEVVNPIETLKLIKFDDGVAHFSFTEAEDRWFRANRLYGNNILGSLDFKYISR